MWEMSMVEWLDLVVCAIAIALVALLASQGAVMLACGLGDLLVVMLLASLGGAMLVAILLL